MRPFLPRFSAPVLLTALMLGAPLAASALTGPFAEFTGSWSGNGTIRPECGSPERICCSATYTPRSANALDAHLRCASDSYNFDLTGKLKSDGGNLVSGDWNENTRSVGGTLNGTVQGSRMQMHVESNGFAADLVMLMQGRRQEVTIDSHGGGQIMKASITLTRK